MTVSNVFSSLQRVADLTPEEAADLFRSAHMMAPRIEKEYGASSLTIAVQDGKDAGQTVAVRQWESNKVLKRSLVRDNAGACLDIG